MLLAVFLALGLGNCTGGSEGSAQREAAGHSSSKAPGRGGKRGGRKREEPAVPVRTIPVDRGDLWVALETFSILEAERLVDVLSREKGRVESLKVEEGSRVTAGRLLAKLDDEELQISLKEAELKEQETERAFRRAEQLFKKKMTSQDQYDVARFAYDQALTQAELARLRVRNTLIVAPVSGVVVERLVEVGQLLQQNQKAFVLGDFKPLLAPIHLPENEISRVRVGQVAELQTDAFPGRIWKARVRRMAPVVDPASGTVEVVLEVPKSAELRPGMYCRLRMVTEIRENVVRIPKKALLLEGEGDRVFVVEGNDARVRAVRLGESEESDVEIVRGLQEGERLIIVGHEGLRDGAKVRDVEAPESRAEPKPESPRGSRPASRLESQVGSKAESRPSSTDRGER